jgi:hypothetical protein
MEGTLLLKTSDPTDFRICTPNSIGISVFFTFKPKIRPNEIIPWTVLLRGNEGDNSPPASLRMTMCTALGTRLHLCNILQNIWRSSNFTALVNICRELKSFLFCIAYRPLLGLASKWHLKLIPQGEARQRCEGRHSPTGGAIQPVPPWQSTWLYIWIQT